METLEVILMSRTAKLPTRANQSDAGLDLYLDNTYVTLYVNNPTLVPTGISVNIPYGYCGLVTPRSGLALQGVSIVNAPGVIDSGYTGELFVNLVNLNANMEVHLSPGERIAQLLLVPISLPKLCAVNEFTDVVGERGDSGHGSSGLQ